MSNSSTRHRVAKPKASLYEEITAHIVADLEAGILPWARPWGTGGGSQAFALPRNAATGKVSSMTASMAREGRHRRLRAALYGLPDRPLRSRHKALEIARAAEAINALFT